MGIATFNRWRKRTAVLPAAPPEPVATAELPAHHASTPPQPKAPLPLAAGVEKSRRR